MSSQETLIDQSFIKPAKKALFLTVFFSAIAIGMLLGLIVLLNINSAFGFYLFKALQLILFFAFGNIYISPKQNFLKTHPVEKQGNNVLTVAFLLCALLSAVYIFLRKDVWLMAVSSSAAFLLPFILKLCWHLFISIPNEEFNRWVPDNVVPDKAAVTLNSLVVRLKITQHVSDFDEKIYTVFIPYSISLGDFFSHFLAGHNTHVASLIEDIDEAGNKYAWTFFESRFYGLNLRRLDPYLTMAENKIKKDAVLYIKRLIKPVKQSSHKKNLLNETIK